MDKDTCLILRVSGLEAEDYDLLAGPNWRSAKGVESAREFEYRVETKTLDSQEYRETWRDREVAAIARPMPLRLIEPVSIQGASAEPEPIHDATWGVYVTGAQASMWAMASRGRPTHGDPCQA